MTDDVVRVDEDARSGTVAIEGDIVSVKITPDRRVWVRWEGSSPQYSDTGRKVSRGLSRADKMEWLLVYRNEILDRFYALGLNDSDVEHLSRESKEDSPHDSSGSESEGFSRLFSRRDDEEVRRE